MLHGGKADGLTAVDERSASWRRSRWMMEHVAGRMNRAGVSVWLLRYGVRGWNERVASPPSPVPDARWALDEVRRQHGTLPVVLLGHSMGGRTAVAVADDPDVVGVVALAPWLPADEPNATLAARAQRQDHLVPADAGVLPRRRGRGGVRRAGRPGPRRALHAPRHPGVERLRREPLAVPARGVVTRLTPPVRPDVTRTTPLSVASGPSAVYAR
jgi:pimeloyl-ACP methyl ester carboxylesterase